MRAFDAYMAIAAREKRVVKVDARKAIEKVHKEILENVEEKLLRLNP